MKISRRAKTPDEVLLPLDQHRAAAYGAMAAARRKLFSGCSQLPAIRRKP
jgi:hypothetical protein